MQSGSCTRVLTDESVKWKYNYASASIGLFKYLNQYSPFFNHDEGTLLFTLSSMLPGNSTLVEIGSFLGHSTKYLLLGAQLTGSKLICIDPFTGLSEDTTGGWDKILQGDSYPIFNWNLYRAFGHTGVLDHLTVRRELSSKAIKTWEDKIDLMFIDGDHTRCQQDVDGFMDFLQPWGILILHDVIASTKYGPNSPSNTLGYLLTNGWKEIVSNGITRAVTRDPEWWSVRRDRMEDLLDKVSEQRWCEDQKCKG